MSDVFENKGAMGATVVVAAANSLNQAAANYVCDGTNDEVEIQAALDALPATGGEVLLLDGTYYVEESIVLDSYQTLRGQGRNTIITTNTNNLSILTATGTVGTPKEGILIADLCIDGASQTANEGIYWTYVNHSKIINLWVLDNGNDDIALENCYYNTIRGNTCSGAFSGIALIYYSSYNSIVSNICSENGNGIYIEGESNAVVGNICYDNTAAGIYLYYASYNEITGNVCVDNGYYGIIIYYSGAANRIINNELTGNGVAPFLDGGTDTHLSTFVVPFSDGSDPQDVGFLIDAATEYARSYLRLPNEVQQVVRMKVYAVSGILEIDGMRLELIIYGAADNENYQTHNGSVANHPSTSANFAAGDVIFWTIETAGVLALLGGDSVEVKVLHEVAGDGDCATNAYLRTVEIEYV